MEGDSGQSLTEEQRDALARAAGRFGTPCYVYFVDEMVARIAKVRDLFGNRFALSYAVKANPNPSLLARLREEVDTFDVSSIGEVETAVDAGCDPARLTFSGPAKRDAELDRAVRLGVGEMVCESEWEIERLDHFARLAGRRVPFFIRINPRTAPRHFQVSMAGRATQFGVDEEDMSGLLETLGAWSNVELCGFHIYSGTNSLNVDGLHENFTIFAELFARFSREAGLRPAKLIFGAGFGIPYTAAEQELDLPELASKVNPLIDEMKRNPDLSGATCALELGRYLVGPTGYFLTTVINEKYSRGTDIRMCDSGFNGHLAACGMLGSVIRRTWRMWNLTARVGEPEEEYMLTGPLCTTVDALALKTTLPRLARGDVVAIGGSGAYGLTSSPARFISHPVPREILLQGRGEQMTMSDVSVIEAGAAGGHVSVGDADGSET